MSITNLTFGPVPSRRFGVSLGIDLSPDFKQCNYDCLYCELKAAKTVSKMTKYPSVKDLVNAVKDKLSSTHTKIDVLTITANGEPTLYPDLRQLVTELNKIKGDSKLLILSNGSTIYKQEIQDALLDIDIVKLSLDCVSKECFTKLDRADKSIETDKIVQGMMEFREKFTKDLILEILFVDTLNNKEKEILLLKDAIAKIKPNRVDIGTIDRPPAYKVNPISFDELEQISHSLEYPYINIAHKNRPQFQEYYSKEAIIVLLNRRALSEYDIKHTFDKESQNNLEELIFDKKVEIINNSGVKFYKIC
ncbi:MAG: radical SAM protein [Arcobacteraceae bacterium]|jgi:wyosine [tRNA(Phe)-imidazoG37] synthetase (radical SAM superfamily)|nr:radical SAM protein [Arcobacteraceae bacterium]